MIPLAPNKAATAFPNIFLTRILTCKLTAFSALFCDAKKERLELSIILKTWDKNKKFLCTIFPRTKHTLDQSGWPR